MGLGFERIWREFNNGSIENDCDAVIFVEAHNYADNLEQAFCLGITDFKKGYKHCPKGLDYEQEQEWGKGWLAMKFMTKRKEPIPSVGMTRQEWDDARVWRWERFRELAKEQGVEIGSS